MLYEFSLPTEADQVSISPDLAKRGEYDGYQAVVIREQDRVRLISRGRHDSTWKCPTRITPSYRDPQSSLQRPLRPWS
jgi:hypothetical protein